jgi:murein L,D-transpeptidase YcbB/YkuD
MTKYTAAENRKAFQRWLAVKDDGIVEPATLAAFDTRMVNQRQLRGGERQP